MPPQAEPVTVTYSTQNGMAVAGQDFPERTEATVVIPAGQTSVTVAIPLLDDAVQEASETFSVVLVSALDGTTPLAVGTPVTVTVLDNDAAAERVAVTMTTTSFTATDGRSYDVTGTRLADVIASSVGDDLVTGGAGDDTITTGAGNDVVAVGGTASGNDAVHRGEGPDTIRATANGTLIRLSAVTGIETITAAGFTGVEVLGTAAADAVDLSGAMLVGIAALDMGSGNYSLTGTSEAGTTISGRGDDVLNGLAGTTPS